MAPDKIVPQLSELVERRRTLLDDVELFVKEMEDYFVIEMPNMLDKGTPRNTREIGQLVIDFNLRMCKWRDKALMLTVSEWAILTFLTDRPGFYRTRYEIMRRIMGDTVIQIRSVDSHVKRLRRKFKKVDAGFDSIITNYGFGYAWKTD